MPRTFLNKPFDQQQQKNKLFSFLFNFNRRIEKLTKLFYLLFEHT